MDSGGVARELEARLALLALPGVGSGTLESLLARFGSAAEALEAPEEDFDRASAPGTARARLRGEHRRAARAAMEQLRACGGWALMRGGTGYPRRLEHLDLPPALLFGRGNRELLERRTVTVVGTRRATTYGRRVAERLGRGLSEAGVVVASGLALGVDAAAHRGALQGPAGTVAVLGCGVDRVHPRGNRELFRAVARDGLLVSEFPPGTPPAAHRFPRRTRVLAALGAACVVVEAGRRSGALITADLATELGRAIFAVPGPVDREQSFRPNRMIRSGAAPVMEVGDILEPLGWAGPGWSPEPSDPAPPPPGGDSEAVWRVLEEGPVHVDELCERSRLPPGRFLAVLSTLEVEGRIRALPGRMYERASSDVYLR